MITVAVMQPYFVPYAGYFRLFAAADVFVVYDCVQFPRRGWVHRNRFALAGGDPDWLTLPVAKCGRETTIDKLVFAPESSRSLVHGMRRFPLLEGAAQRGSELIAKVVETEPGTVADYLFRQLTLITNLLNISRPMVRSSALGIPPELRGQSRVIAIVRALGATRYVNSPGGRELYSHQSFAAQGMQLRFLTPFSGSTASILALLLTESPKSILETIETQTVLAE